MKREREIYIYTKRGKARFSPSRGIAKGRPPVRRDTAFKRISEYWRIHLYLSRDLFPRFTFPLFAGGPLYPPLDCSRTRASINKDSRDDSICVINSLYAYSLKLPPSSSLPISLVENKRERPIFGKQTRRFFPLIFFFYCFKPVLSTCYRPTLFFNSKFVIITPTQTI